ncbi:OmpH family outer membrane protein [Sporomusa malonica]|uniref:Periplasmic chaperone for outer membrane proteins Skp n=1 Tax=Sporomusa malonica TaxID=112901 RepID=A0A1W2EZC5_9FIRM|nr:OmpH family outer membrane protein [Sporomusa malonica]SMD15021.1 periplasmic chaperone for outer membrane proteins Skp [Sporomusa malonica]
MIRLLRKRIIPVVLSLILLLAAGAAQAAPALGPVGYADFLYLVNQHPDTAKANDLLQAEQVKAKQEYESKIAELSDKEKLELDRQLMLRLEQKRLELLKPISDKVVAAANEVVREKGLSIIISKKEVISGGVDVTADVLKKISGK